MSKVYLSELFSRRLLLVTGKGGIGKTLIASALAQWAAQSRRVLLVESTSYAQIPPVFGKLEAWVPGKSYALTPQLSTINLSYEDNFRQYVTKYLGQKLLYDKVFSRKIVRSFINTIPGLAEVMLLGRLFYMCELAKDGCPDLVIFDAPASGHFLSLMSTPQAIKDTRLGGPLAKETERVRAFLADSTKTGTIQVGVPEDLVVTEMLDFLPTLDQRSPSHLDAVIFNRWWPEHLPASCDSGRAAGRFVADHCQRSQQAFDVFLASFKTWLRDDSLRSSPGIWLAEECGAIEEPLPDGFGARFLGSEAVDVLA